MLLTRSVRLTPVIQNKRYQMSLFPLRALTALKVETRVLQSESSESRVEQIVRDVK